MRKELENEISNSEKMAFHRLSRDPIFYILRNRTADGAKYVRFGNVK